MRCDDWIWLVWTFLSLGLGRVRSQDNYTRPVFNCGGDLVADSGFVGSEDFPSYYKPNSKCTWRITVPEGNVVMLSFRIFDLEASSQCLYDYLDVYNGHSHIVQKLGRFCGTFRPGALISTTNTMMLEMVSDSGTGGRGFLAYFSGGKPYQDEAQFCGGKMTKSQGEIKTPNWPNKNYPPGISCSWLITVEPNMVIEVTFGKFDVESDGYCRFDYVTFFNGGEKDDSRRIGKFCGDTAPETIVTTGNVLLVQFVSDQSVTADGFMAEYTSIPRGLRSPSVVTEGRPAPRQDAAPPKPAAKPYQPYQPYQPERPVIITTTTTLPPTTTTTTERYVAPEPEVRKPAGPVRKPPPPRRPGPQNPLCAKACKRDGPIKPSFCAAEFVITGKITAITPGPQGTSHISVSLIKAYKTGWLTISQAGDAKSVKLVATCKKCPILRRGSSYIIMGQVDEEGRGTLAPGAFTALYKAPHHKLLTNINNQPC